MQAPEKLDCKLRPPLESESLHRVVDAAVALQFLLCVFADLREAYFEDIRFPADPGLRARASSNLGTDRLVRPKRGIVPEPGCRFKVTYELSLHPTKRTETA